MTKEGILRFYEAKTEVDARLRRTSAGRHRAPDERAALVPLRLLRRGNRPTEAETILPQFVLRSAAPRPDMIGASIHGQMGRVLVTDRAKLAFAGHHLTGATFHPAAVRTSSGEPVEYELMTMEEAPDTLIDVARSSFVAANPYLNIVEGAAFPKTMADLRDRSVAFAQRPELAGWYIAPTELRLRRPTDAFRLPGSESIILSAALFSALADAGVRGLRVEPSTFAVLLDRSVTGR